jgi:HrpA-like RNA helicase
MADLQYLNFILEFPGIIGVTQPRRVAAVSMALRVEKELNVEDKGVVAYQVPILLTS